MNIMNYDLLREKISILLLFVTYDFEKRMVYGLCCIFPLKVLVITI
jgi:hypothetical protein